MRVACVPDLLRGISCAVLALGTALGVAGCSDDSTRFNYPVLGIGDSGGADYDTTASLPPQSGYGAPATTAPQRTASYTPSQTRYYGSPAAAPAPAAPPVPVASYASGPRVTVQQGDTLSSLSQRYGVPIATIQAANNLADARLQPGQVLVMPGANAAGATRTASATPAAPVVQSAPVLPPSTPTAQTANVPPVPAMPAMPAPRKVTTTTIAAPADGSAANAPAPATSGSATSNAQLPAPEPLSGNSFRWPVKGRIISGFGTKPDGGHNDGVNISVPRGTPVKAAENGVVAYAGNELKGYGNLVLVRHANNWVSAYANNEQILVKRGDKVSRGQVIAKAGSTGSASQPQVHFELRKGSRPVDPTKYMTSMSAQAD
ncbi:MAG: M23 family metallopeptidase [Methyloceanibacter sp.]|nr:M23 family metallopeptidase [Methyloceanibacter sp.]